MAVEDDFSFPTAALEPFGRCGMDSPPLWRLSPAASPISYRQQSASDRNFRDASAVADKTDRFASVRFTASLQRRRRFSSDAAAAADGEEASAAEKMDALWENFNEDLLRSRRSRLMKSAEKLESVEEVEIVKARRRMAELNMPESSGAVVTRRKTTTGIVKVLKKLFLIHSNSRRNLQNRSR